MPHQVTFSNQALPINTVTTDPTQESVISETEMKAQIENVLKEGVTQGHSKNYVATKLHELINQNPELAQKMELPTDVKEIKREMVNHYYRANNQKAVGDNPSLVKRVADCLSDGEQTGMITACAGSIVGIVAGPGPVKLGALLTTLGTCTSAALDMHACVEEAKEEK